MDNQEIFKKNLAKIMLENLADLDQVIGKYLGLAQVYAKDDDSPVTDLDLAISDILAGVASAHHFHFYCEEKIGRWEFPMLMVDPLDGTKEFIAGSDEWVVSVASLASAEVKGEGWIYNPLRKKIYDHFSLRPFVEKELYYGEASRSEWTKGFYQESFGQFRMTPMGSIAFKLARLAAGEIDFVISLNPKNIWDIAAGTLLCQQAGINFYAQGALVEEFTPYYQGPLIWCHEKLYPQLSSYFY